MNLIVKKINNFCILGLLAFMCFEVSASNQSTSLTPKRMIYEFEKIEDQIGSISPNLSFYGFSFPEISINGKEKCKRYESYFFKMAAVFVRHDLLKRKEIDEILKRCPNANTTELRSLLNISPKSLEGEKQLHEYLVKFLNDGVKIKRVISIYKIKRKMDYRKEIVSIFNKLVSAFEKNNLQYEDHAKVLAKLDHFPPSILSSFSRLLIAIRVNNKGWASRLFEKIINGNHGNLLFNIESDFFTSPSQRRRFEERLKIAVDIFTSTLQDEVQKEMLIKVIGSLLPKDSELKKKMRVKWSLQEIRNFASTTKYGYRYPWFWFSELYSRASEVEAVSFIKKILSKKTIERLGAEVNPMFVYHYPGEDSIRKVALKGIKLLVNSDRQYEQYLLMELLKNNVIKRELSKFNTKFRRSRALLERTFYRQVIQEGMAINFCIYNLYRLGDLEDDLLWWAVL